MSIRFTIHRFSTPRTIVLRHRQEASVEIIKHGKHTLVLFDMDFTPDEPYIRAMHWNDACIIDVEGTEMYRFIGFVHIQQKPGYVIVRGSHIRL